MQNSAVPASERARSVLTEAVLRAADLLQLSAADLARVLGVSQPTISRIRSGNRLISSEGSEFQLGALFIRLYRGLDALVGGNDSKAAAWLAAGNHHLNGAPRQRIQSIEGLVEVVNYLDAMRGKN